jgi:hypothetical protein
MAFSRLSHWRAVLGPAWRILIALPTAIITPLAFWRDEVLSSDNASKYRLPELIKDYVPAWLLDAPWYWWAIATLAIVIVLVLDSSFRVHRATIAKLQIETSTQPELELIFDEDDPRCVKDIRYTWFADSPLKKRVWSVGIRNSSFKKSADSLIVMAKHSWFVENTIEVSYRRRDGMREPDPVILRRDSLEPRACEFIELFGMAPVTSGDVFKREHEFVIEARARDVVTVLLTLKYHPSVPPRISKVS